MPLTFDKPHNYSDDNVRRREEDKDGVMNMIIDIRLNQVKIDKRALELYDITFKLNSFLCMTNWMGKSLSLKKIDKLKMYFASDGQKNKHVRSVYYLQEFMKAREPIIKFFHEFSIFTKKYRVNLERKKKRDEQRKKHEETKKERMRMIEEKLNK